MAEIYPSSRAAESYRSVLRLLVEHATVPRLIADHEDSVGLGHGVSWHSQAFNSFAARIAALNAVGNAKSRI